MVVMDVVLLVVGLTTEEELVIGQADPVPIGEVAGEAVVVGDAAVLVAAGPTTEEELFIEPADPVPFGEVAKAEAD